MRPQLFILAKFNVGGSFLTLVTEKNFDDIFEIMTPDLMLRIGVCWRSNWPKPLPTSQSCLQHVVASNTYYTSFLIWMIDGVLKIRWEKNIKVSSKNLKFKKNLRKSNIFLLNLNNRRNSNLRRPRNHSKIVIFKRTLWSRNFFRSQKFTKSLKMSFS